MLLSAPVKVAATRRGITYLQSYYLYHTRVFICTVFGILTFSPYGLTLVKLHEPRNCESEHAHEGSFE